MPAPEPKLRVRALRHLARREYTRQELARVLALHAENEAEVETVLDEFSQRGWLSETRAAEQLVHARRGRYGPVRIRRDLEAKGVSAEVIGSETRAKVVKNKVAPPFRQAEFDILYGEGISREGEIIELGVIHNIIEKSGAWYSYGKDRIGQGKDNTRDWLREKPEVAEEIEAKIRAALGVAGPGSRKPNLEVVENEPVTGRKKASGE